MPTEVTKFELQPLEAQKQELTKLADDYRSLIVTEETFEAAKKARLVLRERRYAIQKTEDENNTALNSLKKQNKSNAAALIEIIAPVEDRIHAEIKAIEDAKEAAREEKRKAELNRQLNIQNDITKFESDCNNALLKCKTSVELNMVFIDQLDKWNPTPEFHQEFYEVAMAKRKLMLDTVHARILEMGETEKEAARIKEEQEAEAKRLAEQKAEQDRIAAENKKRQDDLDAQQRELERIAKEQRLNGRIARMLSIGITERPDGLFQIGRTNDVSKTQLTLASDDEFERSFTDWRNVIAFEKQQEEKARREEEERKAKDLRDREIKLKCDTFRLELQGKTYEELFQRSNSTIPGVPDQDEATAMAKVFQEVLDVKYNEMLAEEKRIADEKVEADRIEAERKRIEEQKPDMEKIEAYVNDVRAAINKGHQLQLQYVDTKTELTNIIESLEAVVENIHLPYIILKH